MSGHEQSTPWGRSLPALVLERLDWAPGESNAKLPLSRDLSTGAPTARAPPRSSRAWTPRPPGSWAHVPHNVTSWPLHTRRPRGHTRLTTSRTPGRMDLLCLLWGQDTLRPSLPAQTHQPPTRISWVLFGPCLPAPQLCEEQRCSNSGGERGADRELQARPLRGCSLCRWESVTTEPRARQGLVRSRQERTQPPAPGLVLSHPDLHPRFCKPSFRSPTSLGHRKLEGGCAVRKQHRFSSKTCSGKMQGGGFYAESQDTRS